MKIDIEPGFHGNFFYMLPSLCFLWRNKRIRTIIFSLFCWYICIFVYGDLNE
jgi:hypothetical protein